MTKQELSQLYYLNREIERDKKRIAELEALATGASVQITGMPHAKGETSDKVGKYASEMADLKSIIELNIQRCWHELNRLNRYIQSIDDVQIRMIFSLRYINGLNWRQIAYSIGGGNTEASVKMAHKRFLEK